MVSGKNKTVCGLKNPKAIAIVTEIRVRSRHVFVENAVLRYMGTGEGKRMHDALKRQPKADPEPVSQAQAPGFSGPGSVPARNIGE